MNPFHLAIPVKNLSVTRTFYKEILECSEGRTSKEWVDFDFFGHQLVLHENTDLSISNRSSSNEVDAITFLFLILEWYWTGKIG